MIRIPVTSFDFLKRAKFAWAISFLALAASIGGVVLRGGLNPGIDFTGGIELQVRFENGITIGDVRTALEGKGFEGLSVQTIGTADSREFLIKLKGTESEVNAALRRAEDTLQSAFSENPFEVRRANTVGPKVGEDLTRKGILAFVLGNLGILVYLAFRFHWTFGVGAVAALIHDGIIAQGAIVLAGYETNITTIAAVLTVIGFSVNDTIVLYDRIRENLRKYRRDTLDVIINRSANETLPRTILTSLTVLFVVVTLFLFGGSAVEDFAFAMIFGVIFGTLSTIFIASPILLVWRKRITIRGK